MSRNSRHDRYQGQRSGESARYRRQDAYWDYDSVEPTHNYQYNPVEPSYNHQFNSYRPSHGHSERYHYASTSASHNHGQDYHRDGDHTQSFAQYYGGMYGQTSQHEEYSRRHDVYIPDSRRYHDTSHSNYSTHNDRRRAHRRRSESPQRNLHTRAQFNSASSPAPAPYVAPPSFRLPPSWPTSGPATPASTPPPSHPSTSAPPTGPRGNRSAPVPSSPSPSYLALSLEPSTSIPHSSDSRKLLILDLNGTLLIRSQHHSKRRVVLPSAAESQSGSQAFLDGNVSSIDPALIPTGPAPRLRAVQPRPYIPTFRAYLFAPETKAWLDTMVWSSAQPHSVVDMVDKCFGKSKAELVAIWDRGSLGLGKDDYFKKTQTTKDLVKPWAKLSSDAALPVVHSALTTLLLDDSPLKARLQPYNHVCIPEYDSKLRGKDLLALEKLSKAKGAKMVGSATHTSLSMEIPQSSSDMLVVPSGTQHELGATNKKKRKNKKQKRAEMESSTPGDSTPAFTDNSRCSSVEVARLLELGDSTTSEEREPSPDESCLPQEEPYDPTLLAVIGVLEALKTQSNVAGWVRSGGLWAGRRQQHTANAEMCIESSTDSHESHSEGLKDHEMGGESGGKKRSKELRTREEITAGAAADILAELSGRASNSDGSPGPQRKVIQTGNDASTVGTMSREDALDVPMSTDALEKVTKLKNESHDPPTMWFEDSLALAYWVTEGRRGLVKLGIEIKHGVEG